MAYADIYNAATDAAFQGRCYVAAWKAAQDILSEAENTPNHAARLDWAIRALTDRLAITGKQLAMQVLRNGTIAANPGASTDNDLSFQVATVIGDLIRIG